MADIERITNVAAAYYRLDRKEERSIKEAINKAMDECRVSDFVERGDIFKKVCSQLGTRGGNVKRAAAKNPKPPKPEQTSFQF